MSEAPPNPIVCLARPVNKDKSNCCVPVKMLLKKDKKASGKQP